MKNDFGGQITIQNTATREGSVIVTSFDETAEAPHRLPYTKGDRVYTTYLNQEGVVAEITPFQTRLVLESGKELTVLNTSVFTGTIAGAKISLPQKNNLAHRTSFVGEEGGKCAGEEEHLYRSSISLGGDMNKAFPPYDQAFMV